ncbi:hypothetical protein NQU49_25635, partial [Escherichia coli]|uniref:hypothetical protein n=1 Tax=Escherichia coli TaxID=562 RepID=UPI0021191B3E
PERQQEYFDNAAAPVSYRGAVQDNHRETVIYVPASMTPTPCSRFRAHSDYSGYDSLSAACSVWKIGDWS